jgi:hypothetical protein
MKYKIFNKKLIGGDVPKINVPIEGLDTKQIMNVKGPLYFNLDKNPIKTQSNSYYQYDYEYIPEVTQFLIDNNLNLNPDGPLGTMVETRNLYSNRIIRVNRQEFPYYLGKSHTNRKFFGRIKFLFQYISVQTSQTDPTQKILIPIKKEDDIIGFIEGLFNISDEFQQLIQLNQRLENPIDKYIFANKFYELLEIITWQVPSIDLNLVSKYKTGEIVFGQIPVEERTSSSGKLENLIKTNDFKGLIDYYMGSKNNFQVKFFKKLLDKLDEGNQIKYIKMLISIDYILDKLKQIFTDNSDNQTGKINLYNLIDLYSGYNNIFLNETKTSQKVKTSSGTDVEESKVKLIQSNIESIDKINSKPKITFNQLLANQVIELINLTNVINKIKNWPITYDTQDVNLHMILLLSYFDLRVESTQIKQGFNLNAIPINKNEALANLFDNGRSIVSSDDTIINTEKYLADNSAGPNVIKDTPFVKISEFDLNFPACVENTILQFFKFLFWDYKKNTYDIDTLRLSPTNFLRRFMENYIQHDKQTEDVIKSFVRPLINLPNIKYMRDKAGVKHELNALASNVLRVILFLLQTDEPDILTSPTISSESNTVILDSINKILSDINYVVELDDSKSGLDIVYLKRINQNRTVLKLQLNENAHGEASKTKDDSIKMDLVKSTKVYKLLIYLTYMVDLDIYQENLNYCPEIIDFSNYNGTETNISSKYFNTYNIYWLNFIKDFVTFYKDCINLKIIPKFSTLGIDTNTITTNYSYPFLIKLSRILFDINNNKYNIKNNNTIFKTNLYNTFYYLILISKIDFDSDYLTLFNEVQDFKFNPNDLINMDSISTHTEVASSSSSTPINLLEQIDILLNSIPNIYQIEIPTLTKYLNILQHYILIISDVSRQNYLDTKFNTFAKIANILGKIEQIKLYDYSDINNRPINLFISQWFNLLNNIRIPIIYINQVLESLIDREQIVLYQPVNTTEINDLPLYKILNLYYTIFQNIQPENPIEIIKTLIDREKRIILNNTEASPLKLYLSKIIYFAKESVVSQKKDIFFKDVITNINVNKEYIYLDTNSNQRTYLYDILTRLYITPTTGIPNQNKLFLEYLDYLIQNELLFNPEIKGNQPVFNIINKEDVGLRNGSILSMYVGSFEEFNCNTFKYLYNKELLITTPLPLFSYILNPNMIKNLNYNPLIIRLLIKNYNDISPFSFKYRNSRNAFTTLIYILDNIDDYGLNFLTENQDSFEIIKLLTSDKRYLDNSISKFNRHIEDNDIDTENPNVKKIIDYLKTLKN